MSQKRRETELELEGRNIYPANSVKYCRTSKELKNEQKSLNLVVSWLDELQKYGEKVL